MKMPFIAKIVAATVVVIAAGSISAQPATAEETKAVFGFRFINGEGAADQLMQANIVNGDAKLSLSFEDAPLTMALMPLAHMLATPNGLPPLPEGATVKTFELKPDSSEPALAVRVVHKKLIDKTDVLAPSMPLPANLIVEDDSAKQRKVTLSINDMSVSDALDAIAAASHCNIFKDGGNIVIDFCEAQ